MAEPGRIEVRGLVLRADGIALAVTRGAAAVMPIQTAVNALDGPGLALWLAGLTWRPPRGVPGLRRVRLLAAGGGTWDEAQSAYIATWRRSETAGRR